MTDTEQPTIYPSALLVLVERWRRLAEEFDRGNQALAAHAFEFCAGELEGLARL